MHPDRVEHIEHATLSMVAQALRDCRIQAATIFREENDKPQDIAEDVLREAIDAMGLSQMHERLYGKVALKNAIYLFVPDAKPVALMLDAKAEKTGGTATIQMSQTLMSVRQTRDEKDVDIPGSLASFIVRNQRRLLVVTVIGKFVYAETHDKKYTLRRIIVACIPNGLLQDRYNPNVCDTIWRAGRNVQSLGEDFRVRLHFGELSARADWRVVNIDCFA